MVVKPGHVYPFQPAQQFGRFVDASSARPEGDVRSPKRVICV